MKNKLLGQLVMVSKYAIYGLFFQCLFIGVLTASDLEAQKIKTVREVYIDMNNNRASIAEIFSMIEANTDFQFSYYQGDVNPRQPIPLKAGRQSVSDLLLQVSKEAGLSFRQINNSINVKVLHGKEVHKAPSIEVIIDGITITGKVTSAEDGEGLPGVNVIVKGTSQGTVTDVDGIYKIDVPDETSTIVFSSVGYQTEEVTVGSKTVIDISLKADIKALEEIVVVGYGTVKKSDLTGSVSTVKASELQETPITSIDQGLVGRASGVMVTQTSGMPGAIASIRIRGTSSLQGGNEPLYVIDGFPIYNGSGFGSTGGNAQMSGLSTINPSDIESIEILKDASATAIYGARAANGVVLITTKGGKIGQDQISFEANYGVQNVAKKIDVMNAYEYAQLVNDAYIHDGLSPVYDAAKMAELKASPEGTNWQNELFRAAPTQNYQLTFSGGNEKGTYSVSVNYYDQDGIIINSNFKRYSGRINLERNILKNFKMGTHLTLSKTISDAVRTDAGAQVGVITGAMKFNPILPIYSNPELGEYTQVNTPGIIYPNPIATAKEQLHKNLATRLLGDIYGQWEIVPNLKAKVSFGVDLFDIKYDDFTPSTIYESNGIPTATINGGYTTNWLNENTLTWSKTINENHAVTALAGVTFQQNVYQGFSASSQDYVNNVLEENSLQAGATYNQPSSTDTKWSLMSYLARVNYSYKDRYLVSVSSRVDGSSRFGKNNKYAFFPSGSVAWRLIEEDFMKNMGLFSDLKLRLSYGITGNQEIGLYNSLATLTNTTYTIGHTLVTGFYPNIIPNPDLRWEKTAQSDVGLDMGFIEDRLRVTADYYYKKTTDLIYDVAVPYVSGFESSLQNIGSVENHGIELAIQSDNLVGDFRWTTSFNISFNRNEVLELGGEEYKDVGGDDGHLKTGQVKRLIVGKPIGLFYGYVTDGLFQDQAAVDAGPTGPTNWVGGRRYKDLSGPEGTPDGTVNATYDRTVIGDPNPDFFGGMTNTFSYKGFEFNVFMQYSYGNDIFNYNAMELLLPSGGQNVYQDLVNRWTPENHSDVYPVATTNRSAIFSDVFIEDGSYFKIKTLTLAYTFPGLVRNHLAGLKVYVTGQNLITFTGYKGYDPEVSYRGVTNLEAGEDFGGYPQAKIFMLGVKLDLK